MRRRLVAVLAADVVGYARMMHADEAGTLDRLRNLRQGVIEPLVARCGGRVVKLIGDGFLVEFSDASAALECAERWLGESAAMPFRIGLHLGEVVDEDGDLMGESVNIAARLEGLAAPGTACASLEFRDGLGDERHRLVPIGARSLKNIADDVPVFRFGDPLPSLAGPPASAGFAPGRPVLVLLPFECRPSDSPHVHLADGMADEIGYALSRLGSVSLASRRILSSSPLSLTALAAEHGVGYALSGSVRVAGARMRAIVSLAAAATGEEIWAERFEGGIDDVFELQDRITMQVAGAVGGRIRWAEIARARRRPPEHLDAYDCFLRALAQIRLMTREAYGEARGLVRRAIEIDPDYRLAMALHGWLATLTFPQHWERSRQEVAEAVALARRAVRDSDDPEVLAYAGYAIAFLELATDEGIMHVERAAALDPHAADAHVFLGWLLIYAGRAAEARVALARAEALAPLDPFAFRRNAAMCFATLLDGDPEAALGWGRRALRENPDFMPTHRALIAAAMEAGREEEARSLADRLLQRHPDFTVKLFAAETRLRGGGYVERLSELLARAGVPET